MKKSIIVRVISVCMIMVTLSCGILLYCKNNSNVIVSGNSTLREISHSDYVANHVVYGSRSEFNLNDILTGNNNTFNTFVFMGTVEEIKSYEVSWTDENDEEWGPFLRNIITVKIDKSYTDDISFDNNCVRVLTTDPLMVDKEGSININIGDTYVFANCWVLDKKYFNYIATNNSISYENDLSLREADVIMGGAWNSAFPVMDDKVIVYHEYLENNSNALSNKVSANSIDSDRFVSSDSIANNEYIILNASDFEVSFKSLLDNAKTVVKNEIG